VEDVVKRGLVDVGRGLKWTVEVSTGLVEAISHVTTIHMKSMWERKKDLDRIQVNER
jgi:hypothetical protein